MTTRRKLIGISTVVALCAISGSGCKKKKTEAPPDKGSASSGSAMAGSASSGSAMAGSGSESAGAGAAGSGSAASSGSAAPPTAAIKFDELGAGWERTDEADGGRLGYVAAVNDSKFPVDNAEFQFTFGPLDGFEGDDLPTDPAKYGDWNALEMKTKVDKTEKIGDAHYFAFFGPRDATDEDKYFQVVKKLGDKLWLCGGSLYKGADYNKIPKVRDEVLANAKKICASMKL